MKEAAGEANMTVITIVLIGIIAAIAIPLITNMMNTVSDRSNCQNLGGTYDNGQCTTVDANGNIQVITLPRD